MGILGLVLFQVYSAWAFWVSFCFRFILHGHSGPRSVSGLFCMGILGLVLFQIESLVEHFQDWVRHLLSAHGYVVVLVGFFNILFQFSGSFAVYLIVVATLC